MMLRRVLWAIFLSLSLLKANPSMAFEAGSPSVVSDASPDRYIFLTRKARDDVYSLLSIPDEERTFENFVFPWYHLKSHILSTSHDAQQNMELFDQIMADADPYGFLLSAIKDVSERLYKNAALNMYQKYLLQNIRSEFDEERDLFFFEEEDAQPHRVKRDTFMNPVLSIFNCAIPLSDGDTFEETITSVVETEADVVCIHDIANEETRYKVYEALREWYDYFCLEVSDNGGSLIASKFCLNNEGKEFLDDNGVFFEVSVLDNDSEIGRVVMTRPHRTLSPEQLSSAIERLTEKIQTELALLRAPILFCGNFPRTKSPSDALSTVPTECFVNGGTDDESICNLLLSSSLYSQKTSATPLSDDNQGLLSVISTQRMNSYLRQMDVGSIYLAECDISGSAGYDSDRGSSLGAQIGYSGDGWSVSVHGDIRQDNSGHTSGGAKVEVTGKW